MSTLKILIADENASIRRLIAAILRPSVQQIFECSDGSEAVACYLANRPDAAFLDIRIDSLDGIEATRRIRSADPSAAVVLITNYDGEDLRQAALRAGARYFAPKDNLPDLVRILEEIRIGTQGTII